MNPELQNLDLIDLISERHLLLRSIIENLWNSSSDIYISNSEWFIMARTYKRQPTISYVSKQVGISRQGTHKLIKSLEAKGLLMIKNLDNNNKDKCIALTELGEECYEKSLSLKGELEARICEKVGAEQLALLKSVLKSDWGL